jgi:type II secretory pathway pseudopilin PulG
MKRRGIHQSKKKAQVWIETVIYTLIGITIIGIVLAVAKPKIDEKQDEVVIEQAIESLNIIDNKIFEVQRGVGNRRSIDLTVGNGAFIVDQENDVIYWKIDSSFEYSELGNAIDVGRIRVNTTLGDPYEVGLAIHYEGIDLRNQYNPERINSGNEGEQRFDQAPTPYTILIENQGIGSQGELIIDVSAG